MPTLQNLPKIARTKKITNSSSSYTFVNRLYRETAIIANLVENGPETVLLVMYSAEQAHIPFLSVFEGTQFGIYCVNQIKIVEFLRF